MYGIFHGQNFETKRARFYLKKLPSLEPSLQNSASKITKIAKITKFSTLKSPNLAWLLPWNFGYQGDLKICQIGIKWPSLATLANLVQGICVDRSCCSPCLRGAQRGVKRRVANYFSFQGPFSLFTALWFLSGDFFQRAVNMGSGEPLVQIKGSAITLEKYPMGDF